MLFIQFFAFVLTIYFRSLPKGWDNPEGNALVIEEN